MAKFLYLLLLISRPAFSWSRKLFCDKYDRKVAPVPSTTPKPNVIKEQIRSNFSVAFPFPINVSNEIDAAPFTRILLFSASIEKDITAFKCSRWLLWSSSRAFKLISVDLLIFGAFSVLIVI